MRFFFVVLLLCGVTMGIPLVIMYGHSMTLRPDPPVQTLEEYVRGVVAAEMPALFSEAALEAQAIAARTYAVHVSLRRGGGVPTTVADVTAWEQAYADEQQRKKKWGAQYDVYARAIDRAVDATQGVILTYEGMPIEALFFASSNGWTEQASAVWQRDVPYLRSVPSPWDEQGNTRVERTIALSKKWVCAQLQLPCTRTVSLQWAHVRRTVGGRIYSVDIDGVLFSGVRLRQALGLASTDISWRVDRDTVYVRTRGHGHGVGMSQWGAQGMARAGKKVEDILRHYYPGTTLQTLHTIAEQRGQ
jgi:stage II sporulation protein D